MHTIMTPEKLGNMENHKREIHGSPWEGEIDMLSSVNWECEGWGQGRWQRREEGRRQGEEHEGMGG